MRRQSILTAAVLGVLGLFLVACGATAETSASVQTESTAPQPTMVAPAEPADTAAAQITTTSTTTPPTTTSLPTAAECAAAIPLDVRIGQLMFPLAIQSDLAAAGELAAAGHLGGIVLIGNPTAAITADIAALQALSLLGPLIVAVDEEGGRVQRLDALTSVVPSARTVAADLTLNEARALARDHAAAIGQLGFTMNLAPVADLDNGVFIGNRSFGADADTVTDFAFATADGITDAGLVPVIKHFPGHGRGSDSHTGLPTLPGLDVLRGDDLVPFVRAAERGDIPIMIGHLVVPGLTDGKPATLSPAAINGLLRGELGFDGLVMTDAFNMDAISATTSNPDAAEQSLAAGVDLVMLGGIGEVDATVAQIVEAVETGSLDEATITESFLRVLDTRGLTMCAFAEDLRPKIGCESGVGGC